MMCFVSVQELVVDGMVCRVEEEKVKLNNCNIKNILLPCVSVVTVVKEDSIESYQEKGEAMCHRGEKMSLVA